MTNGTEPAAEVVDKTPRRHPLANDDGINAPGIDVLEKIATDLTKDVWVVAPEIDNSGGSHSLTLAEPLRMRELGKRHYAVKGTPTDCVIMGVRYLLKDKPPNLILSGVNRGQISPMTLPIPAPWPAPSKARYSAFPPWR